MSPTYRFKLLNYRFSLKADGKRGHKKTPPQRAVERR
uniref:Uncharacterized protein n=1 Tax=Myoviridae sp. ctUX613 TaxID=2826660 RepID=A0A8S5N9M4_9CAUD|nr:MAG TPA: hypothetical protein [Myoviridae sp. ctUX613]